MSDEPQTIITLLTNLTRDVGQIKTDLAVNTTRTGYIEDHLRTLNGKVIKQEERMQVIETNNNDLLRSKKRWDDGWVGALKQFAIFGLALLSAYIISKYF